MDGIDLFFERQRNNAIYVQISLNGAFALADQVRFIGLEAMQAKTVLFRVDRDRSQAQLGGSAHDADSNFTSVGSQ